MNSLHESFGVIFREKGMVEHTKDDNRFFTGSRDSVIKLWQNNSNNTSLYYDLKSNYEGHIDWINDMDISRVDDILFSCSNDKNINIWKINQDEEEERDIKKIKTITPSYSINQYHKDYVKSLCYNDYHKVLFTCGYDGLIMCHKIEELGKSRNERLIYKSSNSIYSIDCDNIGNILLASVYENQIIGFDTRQNKESFHLRGHKDIVRALKISSDGKIGISASSDKTVKLWDLRTHRVLKNWEFHQDTVNCLHLNDNFNRMLTGSRCGEIILTDLRNNCYSTIDNVTSSVTSIAMNLNMEILVSTVDNKLYEYIFKNEKIASKSRSNITTNSKPFNNGDGVEPEKNTFLRLLKTPKINNSSIICYMSEFRNEVIRYHLMKNKVYILCATNNKIFIYNVMKLKKIAEFSILSSDNSSKGDISFEKMIEILDKFDNTTLKTWFNVDIKLGVISLTFNENLFANQLNFNLEYLELIIDKTNSFNKTITIETIKFSNDILNQSCISQSSLTKNSDFSEKHQIFSKTMPTSIKMMNPYYDKSTTCGFQLINIVFNFLYNSVIEHYLKFYSNNFWDTRNFLKSNLSIKNENYTSIKNDDNLNLFLYTNFDHQISIGPYFKEIKREKFKMTSFIKECLQMPTVNIIPPAVYKKEKIEIIIENKRGNIKNLSKNETDELEAYGYITVEVFKNWLLKSYIDVDYLKSIIIKDDLLRLKLSEKNMKLLEEKFINDPIFFPNFIDFYMQNGIYVKNPQITILQLNEILYHNKTLLISLRYAPIESLIERKLIKFKN